MNKIIIFFTIFFLFNFVWAQEDFSGGLVKCEHDPCQLPELFSNIRRLLTFVIWFAFWFAVIISVIGSFLWMLGGPYPNLANRGKDMIKTAIIGYILLLSIGVIFDLVLEFFGPKLKYY